MVNNIRGDKVERLRHVHYDWLNIQLLLIAQNYTIIVVVGGLCVSLILQAMSAETFMFLIGQDLYY